MKSKYYFPHTATVFFLLTVAVALFSWIGSIYGLGKVQKPAQPRRNPVGIEACYGEFCPDTGIGHSNDAFFRVRHYGSFRGMGHVGENSEKRKAHFP